MLLRLLLLKRLSPFWYKVRIFELILVALLILTFVLGRSYSIVRQLSRASPPVPVHSSSQRP